MSSQRNHQKQMCTRCIVFELLNFLKFQLKISDLEDTQAAYLFIFNNFQDTWIGTLPPGLPETVDASYESFDYFGTNSVLKRFQDATRF